MGKMLRAMSAGIAVACAGVSCAQPVPSDGAEAPMGSVSDLGAVQVALPATSAGHTVPVGSDIELEPITSTTSTAATTTVAEVTFDEPDVSAAPVADSAPAQAPPATAAPASGDEDDTVGSAEQVPPEVLNTHLPSAPFRGIVHIHWNPDTREDLFSPRVKLFDTARSELTETQLDPGELGPAPVGVDRCLMWPVVSPAGVELWFYGTQRINDEVWPHGLVVAQAPWGGPMVVHTSDRSDWDFKYASFGMAAAYGNDRIELTADDGGFTLTLGSQQAHFDLDPGRPAGAPPTIVDPDYRPEVDIGWLSWMAGTNGELVAVEAWDGHACGRPNRLYIISFRTGTVVSCTSSLDRFALVATADASDTEVWLEDAQLPPSANLSGMPCEPYDGNFAALVPSGSRSASGSSFDSDNGTTDTRP